MTSALVLAPLLLVGLLAVLFVPVFAKLFKRCPVQEITSEWLETFLVSSYYPMQGLLNDEDFTFLCRQPGFDLSLYRKLRRDRLNIFKQYLNRSIVDFNRLHTAVRTVISVSTHDCSDLAWSLIWLKLRFSFAVLKADCSYRLCLIGFQSLAVRSLLVHLEKMYVQLGDISAAQAI